MPSDVENQFGQLAAPWMTGDFDGLDQVVARDIRYHMPPFETMDLAGYTDYVRSFRLAFPDFRVEADETILEGDRSCHRWHCEGTYSGESPVIPGSPTGEHTATTGTHVIHWKDGIAVEAWHHGDWLTWLTKAGVLPPLG